MSTIQRPPLFAYLRPKVETPRSKPTVPHQRGTSDNSYDPFGKYRPDQRFKVKRDRKHLKSDLMFEHPHCSFCQMELTPIPDCENSAHLVRGRLSCPACVKIVRKAAKEDKERERLMARNASDWNEWCDRKMTEEGFEIRKPR